MKNKHQSQSEQSPNRNASLWTATVEDIHKNPFTKEQEKEINKVLKDVENNKIDFSKPSPEIRKLMKIFES